MKTRVRDTSKKRQSIIDAAIEAFQEEGYESTSMDRIAEVAGASKRTVYNHFESKEALFEAVIAQFMGEVAARKAIGYDPHAPVEEQLEAFAHAKLSMLADESWMGFFRVGLASFLRDPELAHRVMADAAAADNHLVRWIEAAVQDGRLEVAAPDQAATVFFGMIYLRPDHLMASIQNNT